MHPTSHRIIEEGKARCEAALSARGLRCDRQMGVTTNRPPHIDSEPMTVPSVLSVLHNNQHDLEHTRTSIRHVANVLHLIVAVRVVPDERLHGS